MSSAVSEASRLDRAQNGGGKKSIGFVMPNVQLKVLENKQKVEVEASTPPPPQKERADENMLVLT